MHTVGRIVVQVVQVDEQRLLEVLLREFLVADLGREDRLHHCRQGRIAGGQRVVVVEVGALLLWREVVALQEQRQHDIRLLQHLEAVDHERVEVQQQRALRVRRVRQVPHLALEEQGVLRVDAEGIAVRDEHGLGRAFPGLGLIEAEIGALDELRVVLREVGGDLAHDPGGVAQVVARHHVRVEVVVHHGRVLVRTGHAVDVEGLDAVTGTALLDDGRAAPEAERRPEPGRLDRDISTLAAEELLVAGRPHVLAQREADVGVDVVLRRAGGVVGRGLLAVDRAPGEQCTSLVQLRRTTAGSRQHVHTGAQRVASPLRRGVREEREHVDLGVPEVVAAVPRAGHTLRRHSGAVGPGRCLGELEQAPAGGLLQVVASADLHVAARPERGEPFLLALELRLHSFDRDPVERAAAAVDELARRHAAGGVVADELRDADRHPGLRLHAEHVLGDVGLDQRAGVVVVLGVDDVVGDHGDRHPRVGDLVRQRRAHAVLPVLGRLQHAIGDLLGLPRIEPVGLLLLGGIRRSRVDAGTVLTVEQLAADRDRRVGVLDGHLETEDREVTLLEAHDALVADAHALAGRRLPDDDALEHAGAHVERAAVLPHVCHVEGHRLVVDVDAHDLGVRRVHDGLADLREPVGLLRVPDRPGLMQPVDEGAVLVGTAPLDVVATEAEVAVAHREQRLADALLGVSSLDQPPRVDGKAVAVDHAVSVVSFERVGRKRERSSTMTVAPAARSASAPVPRSTPITSA
ncbi:hypothetical protein SRABI76_03160 [Microbacterium oxydans]|nr:hypothetical protein SRABI76_03160 [Microbacterium oxydans]